MTHKTHTTGTSFSRHPSCFSPCTCRLQEIFIIDHVVGSMPLVHVRRCVFGHSITQIVFRLYENNLQKLVFQKLPYIRPSDINVTCPLRSRDIFGHKHSSNIVNVYCDWCRNLQTHRCHQLIHEFNLLSCLG